MKAKFLLYNATLVEKLCDKNFSRCLLNFVRDVIPKRWWQFCFLQIWISFLFAQLNWIILLCKKLSMNSSLENASKFFGVDFAFFTKALGKVILKLQIKSEKFNVHVRNSIICVKKYLFFQARLTSSWNEGSSIYYNLRHVCYLLGWW